MAAWSSRVMTQPELLLHSCAENVTTLGPGPAICLWVQGCQVGCPECTSKETWARDGGVRAEAVDVARWMNTTSLHYLTISGGEPFDQAPALSVLIDEARSERDWLVTCYSGYYRSALERGRHSGSVALLDRLDLLIDGPYRAEHHAPLLWRGSSNQQLHRLTDRTTLPDDEPAGIAVTFGDRGSFIMIGVPPKRGFRTQFESRLPVEIGPINTSPAQSSFPFPVKEIR